MVHDGDQDPERQIDAAGPPSDLWWERETGPGAWDGNAPPPDGPFIPGDERTDEAGRFGPTDGGHPFEASTHPPFVWAAAGALTFGIVSLVFCHVLMGIVALVYGFRARARVRDAPPGTRRGDEVAVAGLVLGAIGIVIGVLRLAVGLRMGV
jgi:hypothetical protein